VQKCEVGARAAYIPRGMVRHMDHVAAAKVASRLNRVLDPLHSAQYFAPETDRYLTAAGLRPGRMCYFASRSAAFGAIGPGGVVATFFNFNPTLVARHIPRAWTLSTPEQVLVARGEAVDATLRRLLGEDTLASPEVAEAAGLAREATQGCVPEGRPLYAAHADLDWPEQPHMVLYHAITLLREFRGDGHIAALVDHGLSGIGALITHTAMGKGFTPDAAKLTRGWSVEEWAAGSAVLADRGIIDESGALTESGSKLRADVESRTDDASVRPWLRLGDEKAERLHELGRALSRAAVAAGAFPGNIFATAKKA
jgi:hypothetical protein